MSRPYERASRAASQPPGIFRVGMTTPSVAARRETVRGPRAALLVEPVEILPGQSAIHEGEGIEQQRQVNQ